jgi:hypothetical protein
MKSAKTVLPATLKNQNLIVPIGIQNPRPIHSCRGAAVSLRERSATNSALCLLPMGNNVC